MDAGIPTVVAIAILVATWRAQANLNTPPNTWKVAKRKALTDITPPRRPIHNIPIPHDRIDKPGEGGKPRPEDKQTRASVPAGGLREVPGERDRRRSEGEQREDGEYVVNGRHF